MRAEVVGTGKMSEAVTTAGRLRQTHCRDSTTKACEAGAEIGIAKYYESAAAIVSQL
jgi:hypothetical protein